MILTEDKRVYYQTSAIACKRHDEPFLHNAVVLVTSSQILRNKLVKQHLSLARHDASARVPHSILRTMSSFRHTEPELIPHC